MVRPLTWSEEQGKWCPDCKAFRPLSEFYSSHRNGHLNLVYSTRCKPHHSRYYDDQRLKKHGGRRQARWYETWGMTEEQYNERLEAQGGGCAICGAEPTEKNALQVDHDHSCCPGNRSCGKCIRGLLCRYCNTALKIIEDSERRAAAFAYLGLVAA